MIKPLGDMMQVSIQKERLLRKIMTRTDETMLQQEEASSSQCAAGDLPTGEIPAASSSVTGDLPSGKRPGSQAGQKQMSSMKMWN